MPHLLSKLTIPLFLPITFMSLPIVLSHPKLYFLLILETLKQNLDIIKNRDTFALLIHDVKFSFCSMLNSDKFPLYIFVVVV